MGFRLANTLSEHGHVSRAVCDVDENGYLLSMTELTGITRENGVICSPQYSGELAADTIVSMNVFGMVPGVFDHLETYFAAFLQQHINEKSAEFYLPTGISQAIADNLISVRVLPTDAEWFGVTYKQDKIPTTQRISELVNDGKYPESLWG